MNEGTQSSSRVRAGMVMGRLIGWAWFFTCLLFAAVYFTKGAVAPALLFLISGGAAWPPLWRWLAVRHIPMAIRSRLMLTVGAFLVAVMSVAPNVPPKRQPSKRILASQNDAPNLEEARPGKEPLEVGADPAEQRNTDVKIAGLLSSVKSLPERDIEGRLALWDQIVGLAPQEKEYAIRRQTAADKVADVEHLRANPEQGAVVERIHPRKEGFGNVLVVDVTLRNDSLSNLKDFQITCRSRGRSGTVLSSTTRVIYDVVAARSTRTFRKLNLGFVNQQATSTACHVDDASIG